jgi:hypothetical protein
MACVHLVLEFMYSTYEGDRGIGQDRRVVFDDKVFARRRKVVREARRERSPEATGRAVLPRWVRSVT